MTMLRGMLGAGLRAVLLAAAALSGCGDGPAASAMPDLALSSEPTWHNVRLRVFAGCHGEGCHDNLTPFMSVDDRATLINVHAAANPAKVRVVPFQPEASFLYQKLTAKLGAGEGDPMPPLGVLLPASDIQVVHDWIAAGALDD